MIIEETEEAEVFIEEETFYLWDVNKTVFDIYKIARHYFGENYKLDSTVIIELARNASANITEILGDIIYVHSGYLDVLLKDIESTKGLQEENG